MLDGSAVKRCSCVVVAAVVGEAGAPVGVVTVPPGDPDSATGISGRSGLDSEQISSLGAVDMSALRLAFWYLIRIQ